MYTTSNEYKNANLEAYRKFESRITIGNRIITNEEVVSINLQQSIQQEATFTIGNTISSILDISFLHNDIETSDRDNINIEIGLLVNNVYEYIPLGIYNIDNLNSNDTTTSIVAYDNMIKFDIPYEEKNSKPTVYNVINSLIELTGIEFTGTLSNYTNYNLISLSGYTCREVLGFLAGVLGCNVIIDRQGKFKFIDTTKTSSITITNENYFNYAKQSRFYKISKIVNEIDEINIEKGTLADDTVCLYMSNPLVNDGILQQLYTKLNGFNFIPFEMNWNGDLSIDIGDSIEIIDKKGTSLIHPILSQSFMYTGGLSSVTQAQGDTKMANTYTTNSSEENKIIRNGNKISQLTVDLEGIVSRVGDLEGIDNITEIVSKYYLSTSNVELLGGSWLDTLPSKSEQEGKFVWIKYVTTYTDKTTRETEPICISAQNGKDGPAGNGVSTIVEEYYLSTSKTTQIGGSWTTTSPIWSSDKYIWTRSKITYTNGTTSYTTPVCDTSWEVVNELQISDRNFILKSDMHITSGRDTTTCSISDDFITRYNESTGKKIITSLEITADNAISTNTSGSKRVGVEINVEFTDGTYGYIGCWQQLNNVPFSCNKKRISYEQVVSNKDIRSIVSVGLYIQGLTGGTVKIGKPKTQISDKVADWNLAPEDNVTGVDVMFYLSTSNTELIGGTWQTTAPEWTDGKYMWQKTITNLGNGQTIESQPTCIAGATGSDGVSVEEVIIQYAKGTSTSTAPTSGWDASMPSYQEDYYLWVRTRVKYSNKSDYVYSPATCDQSWKANAEVYSQYKQLQDKFSWIVKGGTSASSMELTDKMYSLMTEKVLVKAKDIELNGSININNGMFNVATTGNLKIGGTTGNIVEGYERAQFEVTSNGTMYSVSKTNANVFARISEGSVRVKSEDALWNCYTDIRFDEGIISVDRIGRKESAEYGADYIQTTSNFTIDGNGCRVRYYKSGENYYMAPDETNKVRNGSATYLWNVVYSVNGVKTSSDRNSKENIKYLDYEEINQAVTIENNITTKDLLSFIINDYLLATYNYIGQDDTKLSAVAQDVIYKHDSSINKVGELIVDCEEATESKTMLTMNQTQLLNVFIGAFQEFVKDTNNRLSKLGV